MKKIAYLIAGFILLLWGQIAFAVDAHTSIASMAENLVFGAGVMTKFLHFICIVVGVGMIVMMVSTYKAHRSNPKFVPLDRPIMYLTFAIILISIPFLGELFGETGSLEYTNKKEVRESGVQLQDIDAPLNWGNDYNH